MAGSGRADRLAGFEALGLLAGAEIHYDDGLMASHFTVRNPNATASCGCGTSFAIG